MTYFTPDFYEMYDEDFEAFARGEFNEDVADAGDEDSDLTEEEVFANWREGDEAYESGEGVGYEDSHLEGMYEYMQSQWDDDPSPYSGDYSEM